MLFLVKISIFSIFFHIADFEISKITNKNVKVRVWQVPLYILGYRSKCILAECIDVNV